MSTPAKIFVSYRRDDPQADARSICDRLRASFGTANVVMDVYQPKIGARFDEGLEKELATCNVFIAVLGERWLEFLFYHAGRRERDYVRDEIGAALRRSIIVIPVLVGHETNMPELPFREELPEDIRDMVSVQERKVAYEKFGGDCADLISAIEDLLKSKTL